MLRRQLERYGHWLIVIGVLVVLAGASAAYIMYQQRVVTPLADRYVVEAEFESTAGLEPGLGQPVNVAGVRVGSITEARLREGRSVLSLEIDPGHLPRVHRDASAMLVPNTPLADMQVELQPGRPAAGPLPSGTLIPQSRTASPVNLDELLAALDADTRTYFQTLVGGADEGLRGRGRDTRALLRTLAPTAEQLRQVTGALAGRRRELRRAVHNLSTLTSAAATKDRELAQVVERAAATVGAVAGEERSLRRALARLPGTLDAARDVVGDRAFVRRLGTTLDAALPVARRLPRTLRAARPLTDQAPPLVRRQLRPLAREAQPLARELAPTTRALQAMTPDLANAFSVLNHLANALGHNPEGREEGYLFWLAWLAHNMNSTLSTGDAHGAVYRGFDILSCDAVKQQPPFAELIVQAAATVPVCR